MSFLGQTGQFHAAAAADACQVPEPANTPHASLTFCRTPSVEATLLHEMTTCNLQRLPRLQNERAELDTQLYQQLTLTLLLLQKTY